MATKTKTKPKKVEDDLDLSELPDWWMFVERITPAQAEEWLLNWNYCDNRDLDPHHVAYLARQMAAGLWVVNGDPIRFDPEKQLIDGQHRLAASVKSGKSFQSVVFHGVDTSTYTTIDRCKVKNNSQMLQMMGYKYTRTLASAARLMWLHEGNNSHLNSRTSAVSPDEIEVVLECHPGLIEAAKKIHVLKVPSIMPGGMAAFCGYLFYQANPTKAEIFFARLSDGICKHKQVPMYVLRERLTQGKINRRRWTNLELFSMMIRAWNAHYRSRKITMLRLKTKADGGSKEIEIPSIQGLPS